MARPSYHRPNIGRPHLLLLVVAPHVEPAALGVDACHNRPSRVNPWTIQRRITTSTSANLRCGNRLSESRRPGAHPALHSPHKDQHLHDGRAPSVHSDAPRSTRAAAEPRGPPRPQAPVGPRRLHCIAAEREPRHRAPRCLRGSRRTGSPHVHGHGAFCCCHSNAVALLPYRCANCNINQ